MFSIESEGKILGLAHLGYGTGNTYELVGYYSTVFGIRNTLTQEIHHHFIGRINGVTGCPYVIGFINGENDERKLEFVGCINGVKGRAIYRPEVDGHSHLIYTTGDLDLCYSRMAEHHVNIYSDISVIDYGILLGKRAFMIQDLNGYFIQVVEDLQCNNRTGMFDKLVGCSYTVNDVKLCSDQFSKSLYSICENVEISNSKYLQYLWCGDDPISTATIKFREDENFFIELIQAKRDNPEANEIWVNSLGALHVSVLVDDIQKVYERLVSMGFIFVGPPAPVELGVNKGAKAIFTKISKEILLELYQAKNSE